jgi:hypothetical protein
MFEGKFLVQGGSGKEAALLMRLHLLQARLRIRIHVDQHSFELLDPDPCKSSVIIHLSCWIRFHVDQHSFELLDPDPCGSTFI